MIRIISRRTYRFYNPSQALVTNSERRDADGNKIVVQELAIPASVTVGRSKLFTELFFDTTPGEIQEAPDWIKADTPDKMNINTFTRAVEAGMLTELGYVSDEFAAATRDKAPEPKPLSESPISLAPNVEKISVGGRPVPVIDTATALLDETPQTAPPARPLAGGKVRRNG